MAAGDIRIALNGRFNYGTAGSPATTEQTNIDEVVLSLSKRVGERIRRGKKFIGYKPTVTETTLSFKVEDVDSDNFITQLESAFFNDTRIALYPRDHATGKGLDADWYITKYDRNESNPEFIHYEVEARPTDELRDPAYQ